MDIFKVNKVNKVKIQMKIKINNNKIIKRKIKIK